APSRRPDRRGRNRPPCASASRGRSAHRRHPHRRRRRRRQAKRSIGTSRRQLLNPVSDRNCTVDAGASRRFDAADRARHFAWSAPPAPLSAPAEARYVVPLPCVPLSHPTTPPEFPMHLTVAHIGPLGSLIAGVLILIMPRLLNYIVAIYLIIAGLAGLNAIH